MPRHIPTGAASVMEDFQHAGHATVVLWSSRGNHQAAQRLTLEDVKRLQADCARYIAKAEREA